MLLIKHWFAKFIFTCLMKKRNFCKILIKKKQRNTKSVVLFNADVVVCSNGLIWREASFRSSESIVKILFYYSFLIVIVNNICCQGKNIWHSLLRRISERKGSCLLRSFRSLEMLLLIFLRILNFQIIIR